MEQNTPPLKKKKVKNPTFTILMLMKRLMQKVTLCGHIIALVEELTEINSLSNLFLAKLEGI